MRYYFGVYHWRRRFRRLLLGAAAVALGTLGVRRVRSGLGRVLAAGLAVVGLVRVVQSLRGLAQSPPWRIQSEPYATLASDLAVPAGATLLDVGCGTGRSLVGLATALPAGVDVVGLDVFDDRIILGNAPRLADRNARRAGLSPAIVTGDAARLPVAADSVDAVTACRVLHDLPREDAERALSESRRVLKPGGRLGVLELPHPHEADAEPADYWRRLIEDAGFDVRTAKRVDDRYFAFTAVAE